MIKKWFFILMIPFFISCISMADDWKELDLSAFKISIPKEWTYKKVQGEDSFVGEINGPNIALSFDYSPMGYANHLIQTEQEYLESGTWLYVPSYLADGGVDKSMLKVKKIIKPDAKQKREYPGADYIAIADYKGYTEELTIGLPVEVKRQFTQIDTTEKYIIKTVWPKIAGIGITGIYIHSRKSSFNFQMSAHNLSAENEKLALRAFKTITFKK